MAATDAPHGRVVQLLSPAPGFPEALQDVLGDAYQVVVEPDGDRARACVLVADVVASLPALAAIADLRARHPGVCVVVLTFYDHHYQARRPLLDRVADAVVFKPVDLDGLAHTIRRLADRADALAVPHTGHPREAS